MVAELCSDSCFVWIQQSVIGVDASKAITLLFPIHPFSQNNVPEALPSIFRRQNHGDFICCR